MFEKNENLEEYTAEPVVDEVVEEPSIEEEIPEVVESCYIIGGNLNLRKEASVKSDIIKVLPLGLVLDVKEKAGDWTRVSDGSDEGWVMTKFLQFEE